MVDIIQAVVDEKAQLRNDAQLVVDTTSELIADALLVGLDVAEQLFRLCRREDAQISRTNAQVRTDALSDSGISQPAPSEVAGRFGSVLFLA